MCSWPDGYVVAIGRELHLSVSSTATTFYEMPAPVRTMVGSLPHTLRRLAVTFDEGGMYFRNFEQRELFARDHPYPAVGFAGWGWLVVASQRGVEAYDTLEDNLRLLATGEGLPASPVAVLPSAQPNRFVVVCSNGEIRVYEL
jgi:hypothetical protein